MRPRTLLLILILIVVIAAAAGAFLLRGGSNLLPGSTTNLPEAEVPAEVTADTGEAITSGEEPGLPPPTPTPAVRFVDVVIARTYIPQGSLLTTDLLEIVKRPDDNIAVLAGVTFDNLELVAGQIAKTDISRGQELLRPMLALNTTDLSAIGSDLSLYVDQGRVAVAFPIDRYSGAAYALRPGDLVDVLMSLQLVEIDPEFGSVLPNGTERVDQEALLEGQAFLFPGEQAGRLELIPAINQVAEIAPNSESQQIPRQVTQLTIQQAQVLWMGTWRDTRQDDLARLNAEAAGQAQSDASVLGELEASAEEAAVAAPAAEPTLAAAKERPEDTPDVVILSLTLQDALVLKWSLENGLDLDLALRSQGDNSVFFTTSVSLPQLVEQGGLTIPERGDFDLEPNIRDVPPPTLPVSPPGN